MRSTAARVAALVVLYAGVVCWLTWPLAGHLTTHLAATTLPCSYDAVFGAWTLAWQTHALAADPLRLADANIYWPAPHALFYGPTGFGALPLFTPVFWASGNPTLAIGVTLLGGVALTAMGLHFVVARWTGSDLAGFVAAWTLLTTRWILWTWLPMVPYYVLCCWPWILWIASRPTLGGRAVVLLGVLVALQSLTSVVYVTPAVVAPLGVLALIRLARPATRPAGARLVAALALAGALMAPTLIGYRLVQAENPALATQTGWNSTRAAPAAAPAPHPLLIGNVVQLPLAIPWWSEGNAGPLGAPHAAFLLIALGALARRRNLGAEARRGWAQGLLWLAVGLVISTLVVSFGGGPPRRLPWVTPLEPLLAPALLVVRDPSRLAVAALFGIAALAGLGYAACADRLKRPVAALALAAVAATAAYAEYRRFVPPGYPIRQAPGVAPHLLAALRAQSGPLLELPVHGKPTDVFLHAHAMYRSIYHWRPLLNGYASYWPAGFDERMRLAQRLPDADALKALRAATGLTSILVHLSPLDVQSPRWRQYLSSRRTDLLLVAQDDATLLFALADETSTALETLRP